MYSKLTNSVHIAHSGNYRKGRKSKAGVQYRICKITPHQMAGKLTGTQCAVNIFGKAERKASANYCIGYNGDIVCNVEEENRAYTSSSEWNDCQAITIEVSNSANGTSHITDASWNSLVNLCVDICKRYNFRLNYDGTKNGSLTRHNMYASTDCPGQYLQSRLPELARIVNARLDGDTPDKYSIGQYVEIHTPIAVAHDNGGDKLFVENLNQDKPDRKQFWINRSLVKDNKIIARVLVVWIEGDQTLVEVFGDIPEQTTQFWVKNSDVVKVL